MPRKTLKNRIHKYISRKQDICCENDIDRKVVVQQIVAKYKNIYNKKPDKYLIYMNYDLTKMIGYKVDLRRNNNVEGITLWDELYQTNVVSEKKIELLLQDVPLYFLLSFLGYASYKEALGANNLS